MQRLSLLLTLNLALAISRFSFVAGNGPTDLTGDYLKVFIDDPQHQNDDELDILKLPSGHVLELQLPAEHGFQTGDKLRVQGQRQDNPRAGTGRHTDEHVAVSTAVVVGSSGGNGVTNEAGSNGGSNGGGNSGSGNNGGGNNGRNDQQNSGKNGGKSGKGNDGRRLLGATTPATLDVAFIIITSRCSNGAACSSSDVQGYAFNNAQNLKGYLDFCSYGQTTLSAGSINNVFTVAVNCSFDTSSCSYDALNAIADDADKSLLASYGVSSTQFTNVVYILPTYIDCGPTVGSGYVNCGSYRPCRNWIVSHSVSELDIYMHELGHNFGLQHAGDGSNQYGDYSDAMGAAFAIRCYNAAHTFQLAWSTAIADTSLLAVGETRTFTIPAQSRSAASVVRIAPSWFSTNPIYLGTRLAEGYDSGLASTGYPHTLLIYQALLDWSAPSVILNSLSNSSGVQSYRPGGNDLLVSLNAVNAASVTASICRTSDLSATSCGVAVATPTPTLTATPTPTSTPSSLPAATAVATPTPTPTPTATPNGAVVTTPTPTPSAVPVATPTPTPTPTRTPTPTPSAPTSTPTPTPTPTSTPTPTPTTARTPTPTPTPTPTSTPTPTPTPTSTITPAPTPVPTPSPTTTLAATAATATPAATTSAAPMIQNGATRDQAVQTLSTSNDSNGKQKLASCDAMTDATQKSLCYGCIVISCFSQYCDQTALSMCANATQDAALNCLKAAKFSNGNYFASNAAKACASCATWNTACYNCIPQTNCGGWYPDNALNACVGCTTDKCVQCVQGCRSGNSYSSKVSSCK